MNRRLSIPCCGVLLAAQLSATEVKIFRTDSQEGFLAGTRDGVSVTPEGALQLAQQLRRLTTLEEPFLFSAAALPDGWVLGSGNAGKVLKVDAQGQALTLWTAPEPEVFAVWADPDGTVFAGTSPDGKVYRLRGETGEVVFDPPERYIWDLARDAAGNLLVATGLEGRLYRLPKSGTDTSAPAVLFTSNDSHVRTIEPLADGAILVGTAGQGMIVRLEPNGQSKTLYDALQPEVLALAPKPDGGVFAALLASEASYVDLQAPRSNSGKEKEGAEVVVSPQEPTVGSRGSGTTGPRSVIVLLTPQGTVEEVTDFADETVHALAFARGQLWIGTGQGGKLYRLHDDQRILEHELLDRQITALVPGPAGVAVVTTDGAALYQLDSQLVTEGTYTSQILDAGQPARFGSVLLWGELPGKNLVDISCRSGMSSTPDATWSEWSLPQSGAEAALGQVPAGRYVQWRARLRRDGQRSPRLAAVELSYRQHNQRPVIQQLEVLEPGQILVPNNFNPSNQTFEPWSPNREGIFTSLKPAAENDEGRLKTLWKKGYRTLRWQVEDANEDTLVYALEFRRDDRADEWLPVVTELNETYYSFDATVIPDGLYRFRLRVTDQPSHAASEALTTERTTPPVTVDHTPPTLKSRARRGDLLEAVVEDTLSPLREAMISIDAREWQPVMVQDGLLDGRQETLRVTLTAETRLVLLRVTDAAWNVVTFNLLAATAK